MPRHLGLKKLTLKEKAIIMFRVMESLKSNLPTDSRLSDEQSGFIGKVYALHYLPLNSMGTKNRRSPKIACLGFEIKVKHR
jgi:hypothetical protein